MLADQDEPLTWYDEEFDQGWCRFEDHQGRSYWHLLTTDHTEWEPPWLSRRCSVRRADRGVPAPQLVFFVEVIQHSCVAGEIVVFLCHRSRPAVDVERAAVRGFRHGRFRLHGGMLDNGFPLAEMDCVWSVPACNGDLMDNASSCDECLCTEHSYSSGTKGTCSDSTCALELRPRQCHRIQGVTLNRLFFSAVWESDAFCVAFEFLELIFWSPL